MIINKIPVFEKGEIIDKEMLDLLRDNPLDLISLMYTGYSNGIIKGFSFSVEGEKIVIEKGLLKYSDRIFKMKEDYSMDIPPESGSYLIKLRFHQEQNINKKVEWKVEVVVSGENTLEETEMHLSYFTKQDGTYLRYAKETYKDYGTDYNMINIINQRFACEDEEGTLSPEIIKSFGREALKKSNLEGLDASFALLCINNRVKRESLLNYISIKKNLNYSRYTNQEIYDYLYEILEVLGSNRSIKEKKIRRINRMIVD